MQGFPRLVLPQPVASTQSLVVSVILNCFLTLLTFFQVTSDDSFGVRVWIISQALQNTEMSLRIQQVLISLISPPFLPASFHQALSPYLVALAYSQFPLQMLLRIIFSPSFHSIVGWVYCIQTSWERVLLMGWPLSRVELLIGWSPPEDLDKQQPLPQLPFPSPASCGQVLVPVVQSMTCDKKHVDRSFQKGVLGMDSNQSSRCTFSRNW